MRAPHATLAAIAGLLAATGEFAVQTGSCGGEPALAALDFWVGDWDV